MKPTIADVRAWFAARGWTVFAFQREVWSAMRAGHSGLLHASTGAGKTYAVWFGALLRGAAGAPRAPGASLQVLWITPMRALAADTTRALREPLEPLGLGWAVGQRTGDTGSAERAAQDRRMPQALVTTPESLSLLLTRDDAHERLAGVHTVCVDEWHELLGNKRGVQVQLALARLKRWNPGLVVWGLSATLGNLDAAMQVLLGGDGGDGGVAGHGGGRLVRGRVDKTLRIDTLLPHDPGGFSWGGHLGAQMQQPVIAEIERSTSTLVFTNTRSQAEIWYQLILRERPDWAGIVALHHGSLDREVRDWVELGLKEGRLKAVVATSSLDLGVDFLPVERVLQIGSAKGVARLLQRAGRSGHAPGRPSRITLVPTNTLELVEAIAARRCVAACRIESRQAPDKPLDVLVQHLVSTATGGGFVAQELLAELRSTHAYRALSADEFAWALGFVEHGGTSLAAYADYHRVRRVDGRWRVTDAAVARRHRLQVGTIVSDATMQVRYVTGGRIGAMEESFIARLRPGDCFVFAGRVLEFVRTREMTAYVKKAEGRRGTVPIWGGSRMPLSSEMADASLALLAEVARELGDGASGVRRRGTVLAEPELRAALPMLRMQLALSRLPTPDTLLVEQHRSREGWHLFTYPFAGRNVHTGLAALLAWRLGQGTPNTYSLSVNDYGFELLGAQPLDAARLRDKSLFDAGDLLADVLASLNAGELAQRRFREIARVSGLVFGGYPGAPRSQRQLQASSSLFYEVFRKHDTGNLLLAQARDEVLAQELEIARLDATLARMRTMAIQFVELSAPSPFSLPLMVERFRERLSTEKLAARLARIVADAQRSAAA